MSRFEWDDKKAARNLAKHGVTFAEAQEVFDDPLAGVRPDPAHAEREERDLIVGHTLRGLLLLVSFTRRSEVTRIISARKATLNERRLYEEKNF